MPFGLRLLECLLGAGVRVYLIYSPAAQIVAKQECDLVLPARAIELVAAPRGAGPRDASASPAIFVRRDPAAPRVAATPLGDGVVLQVRAAESGGAVVVETPDEAAGGVTTLARVDVEAGADAAPAPIEIALAAARGVALRLVQIDPDGRRSPPRPVYVDDDATQLMQEQE